MNNLHRYHIYVLLCAVILADRRVRDVEIDAFVTVVSGFQIALNDRNPESSYQIRSWFDDHNSGIAHWLHTERWPINIVSHLEALNGFDRKWHLLQAMKTIALSDLDFHKSESDILKFAIDYWDKDFDIAI